MAAQSIWSGTISFSLVAIPVRLVAAVQPGHISFHLLHSKDYARLSRRMICPEDGAPVPREEIVRGYEVLPGNYVLLTDDELESVAPERSRTIEIVDFIEKKDVDPVQYDHPYYLVPAKGGEKAYQLLVEVLERSTKAGLARFVLSEREYLVAITSRDGALTLTTLHYADEVLPDGDLRLKKSESDAAERTRMIRSIEAMIADFDPGKYANGRRKKITDLLDTKVKEKALVASPVIAEEEGEAPADLMAALEESMRKVKEVR